MEKDKDKLKQKLDEEKEQSKEQETEFVDDDEEFEDDDLDGDFEDDDPDEGYEDDEEEVSDEEPVESEPETKTETPSPVSNQPEVTPDTESADIHKDVLSIEDEPKDKVLRSFTDNSFMQIDKDAFSIKPTQTIDISKIAYSEPMKDGRRDTIIGLTKSVRESGVLQPVQVLLLPPVDDEMRQMMEEDGEVPPEYLLLDGLRRVFASIKNKHTTIPANVWDFKDKELGKSVSLELSLWLNRVQKHTWKEIWELYTIMEQKTQIKPAMAEFLFQLEGGDAMKLKDVMLCEYPDIKEELLAGTKTLEQSYKQLMKERKDENELEMADNKGLSDTSEEGASITDEGDTVTPLDDNKAKELLEMTKENDRLDEGDVSEDDFNEMNAETQENTNFQQVGKRTYVDPMVKKSTLFRDNFTCQCCGTGGVAFLDVIIFHHIIPVHAGGPDTVDNGLTLCDTCHLTLHVAERNGGRLPMSKEQFDAYSPEQKTRILKILKLAKTAYKADKLKGYSLKEIEQLARNAAQHRMPGDNIKENLELYKEGSKKEIGNNKTETNGATEETDTDKNSKVS